MTAAPFEIGVAYQRGHLLFLAVDHPLLIFYRGGGWEELRPRSGGFEAARMWSVEAICDEWGIGVCEFDKRTRRYFVARSERTRHRKRGTVQPPSGVTAGEMADELWRRRRLARIAR